MANKSQNAPRMPREIRGKRKDQHNMGALVKGDINERMEKFGMEPTSIIKKEHMSREAERGRRRDRYRARRGGDGGDGDVDMNATTAIISSSEGEVLMATSIVYEARRNNIVRDSSKSA